MPPLFVEERLPTTSAAVGGVGLLLMLVGFAAALLAYLRGDLSASQDSSSAATGASPAPSISVEAELKSFQARLDAMGERLETNAAGQVGLAPADRDRLLATIRGDLLAHLQETLPEQLKQQLSRDVVEREALDRSMRSVTAARLRLEQELSALGRRGNLNLVIGSLTTVAAVILLYQTVAGVTKTFGSLEELLSFYIPRVSTAAFVEVFSFFFLRLYRSGLADMKYYHSELLTLDTRVAALDGAMAIATQTTQSEILKILADTDRTRQQIAVPRDEKPPIDPKLISDLVDAALKVTKGGK
jgi:hypothetical protein